MTKELKPIQKLAWTGLLSILGLMIIWQAGKADLVDRWALNQQGLRLLKSTELADVEAGLTSITSRDCHAAWLLGATSEKLGHTAVRDAAWKEALRCSKAYLPLLEILAPERGDLAALAVALYPEEAEGWLWLAEINTAADPEKAARYAWTGLEKAPHHSLGWRMLSDALARLEPARALALYEEFGLKDIGSRDPLNQDQALFLFARILSKEAPEQSVALYRQGLEANPYDGVRWRELADILRKTDLEAAKEAYYQSCRNGDPGSHGCLEAGRIAEEQGNLEEAIRFYRLSDYQPALDRAAELERQLGLGQP